MYADIQPKDLIRVNIKDSAVVRKALRSIYYKDIWMQTKNTSEEGQMLRGTSSFSSKSISKIDDDIILFEQLSNNNSASSLDSIWNHSYIYYIQRILIIVLIIICILLCITCYQLHYVEEPCRTSAYGHILCKNAVNRYNKYTKARNADSD